MKSLLIFTAILFTISCSHTWNRPIKANDGKGVWITDTNFFLVFFWSKKYYCANPEKNELPLCYEAKQIEADSNGNRF